MIMSKLSLVCVLPFSLFDLHVEFWDLYNSIPSIAFLPTASSSIRPGRLCRSGRMTRMWRQPVLLGQLEISQLKINGLEGLVRLDDKKPSSKDMCIYHDEPLLTSTLISLKPMPICPAFWFRWFPCEYDMTWKVPTVVGQPAQLGDTHTGQ